MNRICILLLTTLLASCCKYYQTHEGELDAMHVISPKMQESDYFLVILVDARHLDYTSTRAFLHSMAAQANASGLGDFGHAWIYLEGWRDGRRVCLEGGHTGETGVLQPKYFDGVMNYNDWGYANPTRKQKRYPRYESNPIKYLHAMQQDGYFEQGAGCHTPTFAAKIDLTEEQFHAMMDFVYHQYDYKHYSLVGNQCSSFVAQIAALANVQLNFHISMSIDRQVFFRGAKVRFWEDSEYSTITFASPDIIEKSLIQAVKEGLAEDALEWYNQHSSKSKSAILISLRHDVFE